MAFSTQYHIHHPSSHTRADIVAAEVNSLESPVHPQSNKHAQPSTISLDAAHIKALGRFEVGNPLASYDQRDLVFLPNAARKYVPAGLFRSSCADQGLHAAEVLLDMQGGTKEVCCVQCGLGETFVLPEKAKKVLVIKDEDGEVVRVGNSADGKAGEGRALGADISAREVAVQQPTTVYTPHCAPSQRLLTPQPTTCRSFDPEAVAFDLTPSATQVHIKSPPIEGPNATSDADEVQAFHPAPHDFVGSPSRADAERWSFSTATTANESEALYQEWLTIGCSSSNCEHCGFVPQAPPREGESRGSWLEVFVQAGKRYDVGCEVHDTCRSPLIRRICGKCLEDEEELRKAREEEDGKGKGNGVETRDWAVVE